MDYENYIAEELEAPKKPIVICDIDGTIADCQHRIKYIADQPCEVCGHFRLCHDKRDDKTHDPKCKFTELLLDVCTRKQWKASKNWREFFAHVSEDAPIETVITWVKNLPPDYEVWMVSGRSAECREATAKWLDKYEIPYTKLLMREERDYRADDIVKKEILDKFIPIERVAFVLDDRNRVVEMWRAHGLKVFQVAEGDF